MFKHFHATLIGFALLVGVFGVLGNQALADIGEGETLASSTNYLIYTVIDDQLVELDENGNVITVIDSGFTSPYSFRLPQKDVSENAIWFHCAADGQQELRKYSLDDYSLKVHISINLDGNPAYKHVRSFAQSTMDGSLYLGYEQDLYSGLIIKVWGSDEELDGYNLTGDSGTNHRVIVSGDRGRADMISYQRFDNTIVTAGGDIHAFRKFTVDGNQLWAIEDLVNHVPGHFASPYENTSFGGRNYPEMPKFDANGNKLFSVPIVEAGNIIPLADGGMVTGARTTWTTHDGDIRKYDASGNQIYSISGFRYFKNLYHDGDNGNTIWAQEKIDETWYLTKVFGTDEELDGYDVTPMSGTNHYRFAVDNLSTPGAILVLKRQSAGTGSINGHVTDRQTGEPIARAIVIAKQGETRIVKITDGDGYYEMLGLQVGEWRVICIKRGYRLSIRKVEVSAGAPSVCDFKLRPKADELLPNYPDPFNPETWIPFRLSSDSSVTISIYNQKGQLIRTINLGEKRAGSYITKDKAAYWDGKNDVGERVSSGVYFYTLRAGEFKATRRMLIVK